MFKLTEPGASTMGYTLILLKKTAMLGAKNIWKRTSCVEITDVVGERRTVGSHDGCFIVLVVETRDLLSPAVLTLPHTADVRLHTREPSVVTGTEVGKNSVFN